jgi:hypothetical protein
MKRPACICVCKSDWVRNTQSDRPEKKTITKLFKNSSNTYFIPQQQHSAVLNTIINSEHHLKCHNDLHTLVRPMECTFCKRNKEYIHDIQLKTIQDTVHKSYIQDMPLEQYTIH